MTLVSRTIPVTIRTPDAASFREAMRHAGYAVEDTGERVTTDAGVDAEAVLALRVPDEVCYSTADRIQSLIRA